MRRALISGLVTLAITIPAVAQQDSAREPATLSHADFAVLLLEQLSPAPQQAFEPSQALADVQELGLVPSDWLAEGVLTHGELADVAMRIGTTYTPADRSAPVSPAFAEAFLRRRASSLRQYRGASSGHDFSASQVLDQGVDRPVSPSDFP